MVKYENGIMHKIAMDSWEINSLDGIVSDSCHPDIFFVIGSCNPEIPHGFGFSDSHGLRIGLSTMF